LSIKGMGHTLAVNVMRHKREAMVRLIVMLALSSAAIAADLAANRDWSTYGGAPGGGHYSALDQISRDSVGRLRHVWTHSNGDVARDAAAGARGASYEVTPIYANDRLYICTTSNRVVALDPETGRELWVFDPHAGLLDAPARPGMCRGVAYWQATDPRPGTACEKRIFKADPSGRVFAVDADTGAPCTDFGTGGWLDASKPEWGGAGRIIFTSSQLTLGDRLILGGSVGDNLAMNNTDGVIRALDARTGRPIWRVVTIPPDLSDKTGGADVWPPFSVDPETNTVFVATGSPSVDVYGVERTADIPYANAVIAIDGADGRVKWHRQIVRHDLFDYDLPDQPHIVTIERDGAQVPAVVQITKMGTVFVFHRDTGEPLFPISDVPVPASDIPNEIAAPTQPQSSLPPFSAQTLTEDTLFGLTPWDRNWCRDSFRTFRYDGPFTPPSEKGSLIFPAPGGGGNWGGAAYDPARNLLVLKSQNFVFKATMIPATDAAQRVNPPGAPAMDRYLDGTPYRILGGRWLSPFGVPCNPPPWGELVAMDLAKGAIAWRRTVGRVPFGPFGLLKSPAAWGSPVIGGPIVTGGGLIFMAGTMEAVLWAYDVDTGVELWSHDLPVPGMSVPMTYQHKGRQYVAIAAGGSTLAGTELGDQVLAFALPE
jgi:quinoprotein glucose dehydrogenase